MYYHFTGYLTTGDERLPGNYGLLDQIQSLRWIQENIVEFRGNPGKVTIVGSSAGSTSVGLLMMSPPAKGKAIITSAHMVE